MSPVTKDYRVTLKEQYSERFQDVVVPAASPEQAAQEAMRRNPGWTAQHQLTIATDEIPPVPASDIVSMQAAEEAVKTAEQVADAARDASAVADQALARARDVLAGVGGVTGQPIPATGSDSASGSPSAATGTRGVEGTTQAPLRTNGPTLEEFTAKGYNRDEYPPNGYAEKDSPAWRDEMARRNKEGIPLRPEHGGAVPGVPGTGTPLTEHKPHLVNPTVSMASGSGGPSPDHSSLTPEGTPSGTPFGVPVAPGAPGEKPAGSATSEIGGPSTAPPNTPVSGTPAAPPVPPGSQPPKI